MKNWSRRCCSEPQPVPGISSKLPLLCFLFSIPLFIRPSAGAIHFRGDSVSSTFPDAPARFAAPVEVSGICERLHVANPIDACSPLRNANATGARAIRSGALLTARGACSFEEKVRNAQDAGYRVSIVYDDRDRRSLISMIGNPQGISIHAVFVSKKDGEMLMELAQSQRGECCISSSKGETTGTVPFIAFVSLVVIVSVLSTFVFPHNFQPPEHGAQGQTKCIDRKEVEVLPCFTFNATCPNDKCRSETCAICLEDYKDGETLRVLLCLHEFHTGCVDSWLTKWGTSCPICKHEMTSGR